MLPRRRAPRRARGSSPFPRRRASAVSLGTAIAVAALLAPPEPSARAGGIDGPKSAYGSRVEAVTPDRPPNAQAATKRPNILFIVSDDQRWDTLWAMPTVERELVAKGMSFSHAHVVTPLCCPARAAILTGQYAHTNGVYGNHNREPHGGFNAFDDSTTIATVLHDAGYRTGLIGKYLNGYGETDADQPPDYVPPGWDTWRAILYDGGKYYGWTQNEDRHIVIQPDYVTDVLGQQALAFMDRGSDARPWFLEWTPPAPHADAVPEPDHAHAFDGLAPWRPATYNEKNVSDKPLWLQQTRRLTATQRDNIDTFRRDQYDTLLSVDDQIDEFVRYLDTVNELSNTIIVYTSDNGYFWGEHRLHGKNLPYEEATRVPYVLRWDKLRVRGDTRSLSTNIDFAPTFADAAGTQMPNADGVSLLPFLRGAVPELRTWHLIEQMKIREGTARGVPGWCMLQREDFTFTHYGSHEEEFYNLADDPLQRHNVIDMARYQDRIRRDRNVLRRLCDPLPPGMTW
jgi:N-acetylglucosamine-6-sulfatase